MKDRDNIPPEIYSRYFRWRARRALQERRQNGETAGFDQDPNELVKKWNPICYTY